jgi:uncharacterized membrane protein YeaQ/YmgE (transglycosylase-associated protein family)
MVTPFVSAPNTPKFSATSDISSSGPWARSRFISEKSGENGMNWMPILIQLISGGVGGNIAGALLKRFNLGIIGNTIAGILGGIGGGQLLTILTGSVAPATSGGLDMSSILSSVGGGGVGGAVIMVIVGLVKDQMAKSAVA